MSVAEIPGKIFHEEAREIITESEPLAGAIDAEAKPGAFVLIVDGEHAGLAGTVIGARRLEIHPEAAATIRVLRGREPLAEHYLIVLDGALTMRGVTVALDAVQVVTP